jgi:hypothetical protein
LSVFVDVHAMAPKEVRFDLSEDLSHIQIHRASLGEASEEYDSLEGLEAKEVTTKTLLGHNYIDTGEYFDNRDSAPSPPKPNEAQAGEEFRTQSKDALPVIEDPSQEWKAAHLRDYRDDEVVSDQNDGSPKPTETEFLLFRLNYLLVTTVIKLADGLQGTSPWRLGKEQI